ncbi:hypothetical protein DEDE109153_09155 [Deinococcus deserti]|uniref:Uncharacterized protein n=1 Tax=Deinococcus deserti (strain DSM 17065 / CIP 109153 / LMG 22923 / VCD115) TaxID=546414 RepID=X5H5W8_DEIDV|nr:hypothetical protein [Deinococcus deserti]AHX26568.1 hypothetical protein Deide_3p00305 [Deinococcus deserti VCD115]
MKKSEARYVAKNVPGVGWRVWSTPVEQWWGNAFPVYPAALLDELNGPKRTDRLLELNRPDDIRS